MMQAATNQHIIEKRTPCLLKRELTKQNAASSRLRAVIRQLGVIR